MKTTNDKTGEEFWVWRALGEALRKETETLNGRRPGWVVFVVSRLDVERLGGIHRWSTIRNVVGASARRELDFVTILVNGRVGADVDTSQDVRLAHAQLLKKRASARNQERWQ